MKKLILLSIFVLLGLGLVFGTGQQEGEDGGPVDLTLWGWIFTGNDGTAIRAAVENYQNENPNVTLELQDVNWAQAHDSLILMSQSNNMPDIPMINRNWLVEAVSLDILEDLTPRLQKDGMADMFYPPVRGDYKGKDYILPYAGGNSALIINKTMFQDLGLKPPATFDDFVALSKKVTNADNNFYGTAFCISEANVTGACVCNLLPVMYSFGAKLVENNKAVFNSKEGVDAFQWMIDMEKKMKLAAPGSVTIDARKMREVMIAENALMVFDGAWGAARYGGIDIDIVKMPKKKEIGTVVNIACWGLPKDGEQNDASWEFLKYLYSDKYLEMHFDSGVLPFSPKFGEMDKYQQKFSGFLDTLAESENYFQTGSLPNESELYRILVRAYQEAYHGEKDVQTAMDDAALKYTGILTEFFSN